MDYKEYCAMKAFEYLFSDLTEEPKDFGFNTWLELYEHIQSQDEYNELKTSKGEVIELTDDYWGAYIPTTLEYEFTSLTWFVKGMVKHNVDLSTINKELI